MISDREWFVVSNILVPNPQYTGTHKRDDFVWTDSRPYPEPEVIEAALAEFEAEQDRITNNAAAKQTYLDTLDAGLDIAITDWNGVSSIKKFYCNERAAIDLCMVLVLNSLDEEEPVYCMTMDGAVELSYAEFKRIAVIIGRHFYGIRQIYWSQLQ